MKKYNLEIFRLQDVDKDVRLFCASKHISQQVTVFYLQKYAISFNTFI